MYPIEYIRDCQFGVGGIQHTRDMLKCTFESLTSLRELDRVPRKLELPGFRKRVGELLVNGVVLEAIVPDTHPRWTLTAVSDDGPGGEP
jgi:hypothetical protein